MEDDDRRRGRVERARLVDRVAGPLDAWHILTETDAAKADAALEQLVDADSAELAIAAELGQADPLADPEAFPSAHRTFARALEVHDRGSRRWPTALPAGPLRPLARPLVGLLAAVIARHHQRRVLQELRTLYVMRETNSVVGSREHRMLTTARRQLDQMAPDLTGRSFAVPAFLLGGAALSAFASFVTDLARTGSGRLAMLVVILLVTVGAFWCILMAAAVSRRRTRLVLDQSLRTLWASLGAAGEPPHDPSRVFVAVASGLLVVGWVIAPLLAAVLGRYL